MKAKSNVLFIGTTVYTNPLNRTFKKKFKYLNRFAEIYVIAFIKGKKIGIFEDENVKFYLTPHGLFLRVFWYYFFAFFIASYLLVKKKINIIVFQSAVEGTLIFPLKFVGFFFKKQVCFVVERHSNLEEAYIYLKNIKSIFRGYLLRCIIKNIATMVVKRADVLRAISNQTKKDLYRAACEKKIIVFPTWTDIEIFLEEGNKKDKKENQVLFVGSITKVKGIHYLIEAFAKIEKAFPHVRLLIVGGILDCNYYKFLKQLTASYGLEDKVDFMPHLPQKDLAKLMSKSLVLVLPSVSEGLPRVLIESLAAGTPVIASNVGGIPDVVDDGVDGFLFEKGKIEELAEKIKFFLEDKNRSYSFGERGRQKVLKLFSPEKYVEGYRKIFETCKKKINDEH